MSERPTGIPKTRRLDTGQAREKRAAQAPSPDPAPTASASDMELTFTRDIGKKIAGRYKITDVIGEGGMGVVYEAWDTQVERKVAIKLVRSDTTDRKFLSRFRRELEITSKLRHPSTIRVFEHGETKDGRPYMVMELLTGESLADRLEQGPLDEMEALQIARQAAESLSEAHEHGVFHRDLKPDNIFIETVGVSKVVKVLDFGIAGGVDATRLTQAGEVFGTPQYMSPEQCNGLPLDHRTDIYSLACILYEMLEGRPPFAAETPMATMLKHVRAKVPPPRHASKETAKVVLMGLRKDRSKRIQTAGRLAELIGQCIGHLRSVKEGRIDSGPSSAQFVATPPVSTGHSVITRNQARAANPSIPPAGPTAGFAEDRRGRTIAIGLGLLAIGLVIAMFFGDMSSGPSTNDASDKPKNGASSKADGTPPKKLPMNRAVVQSNVDGAQVYVDDAYQCDSPCEVKVPVGDGLSHEIRVKKEGYVDLVKVWKPKSVAEPLPTLPPMEKL
ncbi:MAG: serine/threonine-protein kinase [Myxococcota bacterium]